jgi:hypothetical protein
MGDRRPIQKLLKGRRVSYDAAFKLRIVREALCLPPGNRIKPTCRAHPPRTRRGGASPPPALCVAGRVLQPRSSLGGVANQRLPPWTTLRFRLSYGDSVTGS